MSDLTLEQKRLVRASFESLEEYSDSVVQLFYGRLFEIAPQVRPLFRTEISQQSRKLLDMLTTVVGALDHFDGLRPKLEELGYRHIAYGARPEHYDAVRVALLWAMGNALDLEFDKETKAAWAELLGMVAGAMIEGATRIAAR